MEFAAAISASPALVSDDLRARLEARFSRSQIAELAAEVAWENQRARLNQALGVRPSGFSDGSFCLVPEPAAAWLAAPGTVDGRARGRQHGDGGSGRVAGIGEGGVDRLAHGVRLLLRHERDGGAAEAAAGQPRPERARLDGGGDGQVQRRGRGVEVTLRARCARR